jgi:hypothetical protein
LRPRRQGELGRVKVEGLAAEYAGWTKRTEAYVLALRESAKKGNEGALKRLGALVGMMNTTSCPRGEADGDGYLDRWLVWARKEVTGGEDWPAEDGEDDLADEEEFDTTDVVAEGDEAEAVAEAEAEEDDDEEEEEEEGGE